MMQNQKPQRSSNVEKLNTNSEDTKRLLDAYLQHKQLFLFNLDQYQLSLVFRPLTIGEVEAISKLSKICDSFGIEDWIIDNTVIFSTRNIDNLPAGIVSKTANMIMKQSVINDDKEYKELLDKNRGSQETLDFLVNATINKVYPTIDLHNVNYTQQTKLLAISESILGTKILIGEESNRRRRGRGPAVPEGFSSIPAGEILSPELADKPDFKKDNAALEGR